MFYTFSQNNSGGSWVYDEKRGLSAYVIVEGDSKDDITNKARRIGLYFDGCNNGSDCSCCGDRWNEPYDFQDLDDEPSIYSDPLEISDILPDPTGDAYKRVKDGMYDGFIHYDDGKIVGFWKHKGQREDLDGKYGYGMQFNRFTTKVDVFVVGENGFAEDGNRQAWEYGAKQPTKACITPKDGWGYLWAPTEDEAKVLGKAVIAVCKKMKLAIDSTKKSFTDPNEKKVAKIW